MLLTALLHGIIIKFASLELGNTAFQQLDHFTILHLLLVLILNRMVQLASICAMIFPSFM